MFTKLLQMEGKYYYYAYSFNWKMTKEALPVEQKDLIDLLLTTIHN